jgi:hypothetical protein
MVVRDILNSNRGLILNTILISFAIVLSSGIPSKTLLLSIPWQSTHHSDVQQQPFRPAQLGLPTRREGGGCR